MLSQAVWSRFRTTKPLTPQSLILAEFWDLGHKLFRTTPETFPVPFFAGNALDATHIEIVPPFTMANPPPMAPVSLSDLTSLNPLRGHVSAIYTASVFHLFQEEQQLHLARALAALLSPEPGSMIFGIHRGLPEKGHAANNDRKDTFCHSPDSWIELWDGMVFEKGSVRVVATLVNMKKEKHYEQCMGVTGRYVDVLSWHVTRL